MSLPKWIKLPFAAPIKVVEMAASHEEIEGCLGLWDDEERIIYIRKDLSKRKKREILYHELLHAVHDTARQLEW